MMDFDDQNDIPIMKGWVVKHTKDGGLFKRTTSTLVFCVLNIGTISCYDKEDENFPYGRNLSVSNTINC